MNPCMYCGVAMSSPRRKQCGAPDCKRLANNARARRTMDAWRAEHGTHYSDKYRPQPIEQTCQHCGATFRRRNLVRSCSHPCQRALVHQARLERQRVLRRRQRVLARLAAASTAIPGRYWVAGNCRRCGAAFVGRLRVGRYAPDSLTAYCGIACKRNDVQTRRRARIRGAQSEPYSRAAIFERDGWRCHICKHKTNPAKSVPHPRAPTIDHVVPLNRGGDDTPANVATACFICNSRKRDTVADAQLALLG